MPTHALLPYEKSVFLMNRSVLVAHGPREKVAVCDYYSAFVRVLEAWPMLLFVLLHVVSGQPDAQLTVIRLLS